MASVELVGVSKLYGATRAVDDISLKVPDGSYCCLLGPSGCGKTSTLRMIAGHESISRGDVRIGEQVVNDLPPVRRAVFHEPETAFVARFIGGHNVLPADLLGLGRGEVSLRADLARLRPPRDGEVGLEAAVSLVEYQGTSIQIRLAAPAGREVQVLLDEAAYDAAPVAAGQRVSLSWPRDAARALAA